MTRTPLAALHEEMRAMARGERATAQRSASAAPLQATLSREALDLLGVVLRDRPATLAALVALTGRSQPNVSRPLQPLARLRLIRLVRTGREVRPEPIARAVRVDLTTGTHEVMPVGLGAA